jgi:hypothetical protein
MRALGDLSVSGPEKNQYFEIKEKRAQKKPGQENVSFTGKKIRGCI